MCCLQIYALMSLTCLLYNLVMYAVTFVCFYCFICSAISESLLTMVLSV